METRGWNAGLGRGRVALAALAIGFLADAPASADPVDYPEILLELPPPPPDDLQAFIASAIDATRFGGGSRLEAKRKLEAHFADDVRLYVGAVELTDGENFDLVDTYPSWTFIRHLGDLASYDNLFMQEEEDLGVKRLRELLERGVVGPNPWMHGEMCTAAYGKLPDAEMRQLLDDTGTRLTSWRIADIPWEQAGFMGRTGPFRWKVGQLLYVDQDAPKPANCCWDYVQKPDGGGGYVTRPYFDPVLRSYLNSHVCFARNEEGAWKINAVGYRTP